MAKMRVVQVPKAKGPFEIVEREIPQPGPGDVRIKVQACGVCHSDSLTKDGLFPNIAYPRIPGHEVAGVLDAIGDGVKGWKLGDRVGVGWYGGHCGYCDSCRRGNFGLCLVDRQVTGISHDGGYAEYMIDARSDAGADSGRSLGRGCGAADVRRRDHVQFPAQFGGRPG